MSCELLVEIFKFFFELLIDRGIHHRGDPLAVGFVRDLVEAFVDDAIDLKCDRFIIDNQDTTSGAVLWMCHRAKHIMVLWQDCVNMIKSRSRRSDMPEKKYSINWENDEPVSFEVDGVPYESLDQIPDDEDREKLTSMLDAALDQLLAGHTIVQGHFSAAGGEPEYCDRQLFEKLYRRTLNLLRHEVQPAPVAAYQAFRLSWQGVRPVQPTEARSLDGAMRQLRGLALPVVAWEREVLPARASRDGWRELDGLVQAG